MRARERLGAAVAAQLARGERVERVVARSGYSHRRFVELFRREVGLAPKAFAQAARVDRALRALQSGRAAAEAAHRHGYADQAHLQRAVRRALGITPREYARAASEHARHIPLTPGQLPSILRAPPMLH